MSKMKNIKTLARMCLYFCLGTIFSAITLLVCRIHSRLSITDSCITKIALDIQNNIDKDDIISVQCREYIFIKNIEINRMTLTNNICVHRLIKDDDKLLRNSDGLLVDQWGKVILVCIQDHYMLVLSAGRDGVYFTSDDVFRVLKENESKKYMMTSKHYSVFVKKSQGVPGTPNLESSEDTIEWHGNSVN